MSDFYGFPDAKGKKKRKIKKLKILVLELKDQLRRKDEVIKLLMANNKTVFRKEENNG